MRGIINRVYYQRYGKSFEQQKRRPIVNVGAAEENLEEKTICKSVFNYRFNSNKHTNTFLFVTQAFCYIIVRICFFLVYNSGLFKNTA